MSNISTHTIARVVDYLSFLKTQNCEAISATTIADSLGLNHVQVRKDLAAVATGGKPKVGYNREQLMRELSVFLGYDKPAQAILVGAGNLGKALISYSGFESYGLNIVAAFDVAKNIVGTSLFNTPVYHLDTLSEHLSTLGVKIALLCVNVDSAQAVTDTLIANNIKAIWNFTPKNLKLPPHVVCKNENMPASFAILSKMVED